MASSWEWLEPKQPLVLCNLPPPAHAMNRPTWNLSCSTMQRCYISYTTVLHTNSVGAIYVCALCWRHRSMLVLFRSNRVSAIYTCAAVLCYLHISVLVFFHLASAMCAWVVLRRVWVWRHKKWANNFLPGCYARNWSAEKVIWGLIASCRRALWHVTRKNRVSCSLQRS